MPHTLRISAGAVALGAALAVVTSGVAGAQPASPIVGHVYTDLNTAHANEVAGYARHADGSLTALPGSPFEIGGAGTGKGIGSQGALQFADGGKLLLAVDPGSNEISVLDVAADGTLAKASIVSSGGDAPASLAVSGSQVYVADQGPKHAGYVGFSLSGSGTLTAEKGAAVKLAADADPGDVLINATGTELVGTEVGPSVFDSFTIGTGGTLTKAKGSPVAAQGPGPFGSAFDPADPNRLFVSNAHGGDNAGTVSAFNDRDGVLSSIGSGPFNDLQTAPCWVAVNAKGSELFAVNTAVPSVSRYAIAGDGALRLTATAAFTGSAKGPEDAGLAPDGRSLFVADTAADAIRVFSTARGRLVASKGVTKLPHGSAPFGIAVN